MTKKLCIALAAATTLVAGTAAAQAISDAYATKGACQKALAWAAFDERRDIFNPLGALPANARCEKIGGSWYIVV